MLKFQTTFVFRNNFFRILSFCGLVSVTLRFKRLQIRLCNCEPLPLNYIQIVVLQALANLKL